REVGTVSIEASNGRTDRLGVTPGHPFWVQDVGWLRADQLQPGQELFSSHGGWLRVTGSTWAQERATVYNLSVEDAHTYFVGETAALVHNTCPKNEGRMGMAGENHPVSGVHFNESGFPEFESLFDLDLPKRLNGSTVSDAAQFRYATRALRDAVAQDPEVKAMFTGRQLED